ncbi:MAG: hypothetical protein IT578_02970 [Verrucomicrobiae bacterium]|nr:hypothetical protein [Verrucomicrobiae bacterium]
MNGPDERAAGSAGTHSAFLPVFLVFLAFLAGYSLQMVQVFTQNAELRRTAVSEDQTLARAPLVLSKLKAVSKDLEEAAATNPVAKQLLTEFGARPGQPAR